MRIRDLVGTLGDPSMDAISNSLLISPVSAYAQESGMRSVEFGGVKQVVDYVESDEFMLAESRAAGNDGEDDLLPLREEPSEEWVREGQRQHEERMERIRLAKRLRTLFPDMSLFTAYSTAQEMVKAARNS